VHYGPQPSTLASSAIAKMSALFAPPARNAAERDRPGWLPSAAMPCHGNVHQLQSRAHKLGHVRESSANLRDPISIRTANREGIDLQDVERLVRNVVADIN
jgi:hypothetical protein